MKKSTKLLNPEPEVEKLHRLKKLAEKNSLLPEEKQKNRYELLLEAGYSKEKARSIENILVENDSETQLKNRGFDANSAKLVIQEIAHDKSLNPDIRLKAAKEMLEVLGLRKSGGDHGEVANTLANILQDIYKNSENRPKLLTVNEVNSND